MNKRRKPRRARPLPFRVPRETDYNVERLIGLLLHERFGADGFREAEAYFNKTGGEQCYWEAMTWLAQQTPAVIRAELNLYAHRVGEPAYLVRVTRKDGSSCYNIVFASLLDASLDDGGTLRDDPQITVIA